VCGHDEVYVDDHGLTEENLGRMRTKRAEFARRPRAPNVFWLTSPSVCG